MLKFKNQTEVYVSTQPVDMRRSIDGLSCLVHEHFGKAPQSGHVFVFFNRYLDKAKVLWWDKNGYVVHYKRLERHRFKHSPSMDISLISITQLQLNGLLAGLDFMIMADFPDLSYEQIF